MKLLRVLTALVAVALIALLLTSDIVVTYGNSMGPRITAGDLVITKPAQSYQVGDAIAYRGRSLADTIIFHRIVEETPTGFVTQGDNNNFLDPDRPTSQDIIGVEWFVIPGAGKWLNLVTTPAFLGGLAFFLVIITWVGSEGRRNRRRMRRDNGRAPLPDWI